MLSHQSIDSLREIVVCPVAKPLNRINAALLLYKHHIDVKGLVSILTDMAQQAKLKDSERIKVIDALDKCQAYIESLELQELTDIDGVTKELMQTYVK